MEAIRNYIEEYGYPPTVRELSKILGVGLSATHNRLRKAQEQGLIEVVPDRARAIIIKEGQ